MAYRALFTYRRYLMFCVFGVITYSVIKCGTKLEYFKPNEDRAIYDRENEDNPIMIPSTDHQTCRFPDLNVSDESVAKYFHANSPIVCDTEPDWIYIDRGKAYVCEHVKSKHGRVKCNFTFLRWENDFHVADGARVFGTDSEPVELKSDFFRVRCEDAKGKEWNNIMAGVYRERKVTNGTGKEGLPKNSLGLDVLIWGHDSLSRLTFMRKLPKTYKYLTQTLGAIVLKGYNIVGDGTPQALIPILTGKTEVELPETRRRMAAKAQFVNVYPFIWNDFRDRGYVTAFNEDCPRIGAFAYRLKGFNEQPTDHYMRTFFLAASKEADQHPKNCFRATPRHKVTMNWIKEFFAVYNDKPKFAFSFSSALSHDDISDEIGATDDDLHDTISFLKSKMYLDHTLLIVMSDHGSRYAKFRETQQGKQEERLPFFAFVFPPWFKIQHPVSTMNFVQNAERLTTPFDIYLTLRDVLHFEGPGVGSLKDRGISLFKEIPANRTCQDAAIDPHWCTCLHWSPSNPTDPDVEEIAVTLVRKINEFTKDLRDICEAMELDNIIWAGRLLPDDGLLKFRNSKDADGLVPDMSGGTNVSVEMYQIQIRVRPGNGHFEATVKKDKRNNEISLKASEISGINKYGRTAECLEDIREDLRKFCCCKHSSL